MLTVSPRLCSLPSVSCLFAYSVKSLEWKKGASQERDAGRSMGVQTTEVRLTPATKPIGGPQITVWALFFFSFIIFLLSASAVTCHIFISLEGFDISDKSSIFSCRKLDFTDVFEIPTWKCQNSKWAQGVIDLIKINMWDYSRSVKLLIDITKIYTSPLSGTVNWFGSSTSMWIPHSWIELTDNSWFHVISVFIQNSKFFPKKGKWVMIKGEREFRVKLQWTFRCSLQSLNSRSRRGPIFFPPPPSSCAFTVIPPRCVILSPVKTDPFISFLQSTVSERSQTSLLID